MSSTVTQLANERSPSLPYDPMSAECNVLLSALQERQMGRPALLFAAGHRPLAFVLGQCLYALAPLAAIVGWDGCADWATLLSHPDGPAFLEESLHDGIE